MHGVSSSRPLRLAYLTAQYPKVSHTFIRREILELERRGHDIVRLSIRHGGEVFDPSDRAELERTFICLDAPKADILAACAYMQTRHPLRWARAMQMAHSMHQRSDRGFVTHAAYLAEAATLTRLCQQRGVEHLHVHFGTNACATARLMRCLGGPPYSITIHGPDDFDAPRELSLGAKVSDASFVVAISNFASAQVKRWSDRADWPKIHVVRCTVGPEFFERTQPIPSDSVTFVNVARLSAAKGQFLLIDAVRKLRDQGLAVRLVFAGDGELRQEIEQAIAQNRLEDCISITGWVNESQVREHLQGARALVLPSFAEGLPVSIMESLAMRRPVIVTSIAGVPELVKHRENGWLVSAGSVPELVTAMSEALRMSTTELDRLGATGASLVHDLHFTPTQVDVLERLFLQYRDVAVG